MTCSIKNEKKKQSQQAPSSTSSIKKKINNFSRDKQPLHVLNLYDKQ